jgi:hypothetical protein
MNIILIFSTEPVVKDRLNSVKFSVIYGLEQGFINPLSVRYCNGEYSFMKSTVQQTFDKRIGSVTFRQITNYSQIKPLTDRKLIEAFIIVNQGTPVKLPNTLFFDCHFPVSDIPKKDLRKYRIVQVS